MGGLFKTPKAPEPIAPAAPVEQATFKVGESKSAGSQLKSTKVGKKKLQIGVGAASGTGLNTGA
jgi:hypothetical protein